MIEETVTLCIDEYQCVLDRDAVCDVLIALLERHYRICKKIATCGDMEEATDLAQSLEGLRDAYVVINDGKIDLDKRLLKRDA